MANNNSPSGASRSGKLAKIGCGVVIAIVLLAAFLVWLAPDPAAESTDLPKAKVVDAGLFPPALNLEIDFGSVRSPDVITATGVEMEKLGRQMITGPQPVIDSVSFINFQVLGGPSADASVGRKIMLVTLSTDTMKALARRNANATEYLNAVSEASSATPANDDIISAFCVSPQPICHKLR